MFVGWCVLRNDCVRSVLCTCMMFKFHCVTFELWLSEWLYLKNFECDRLSLTKGSIIFSRYLPINKGVNKNCIVTD